MEKERGLSCGVYGPSGGQNNRFGTGRGSAMFRVMRWRSQKKSPFHSSKRGYSRSEKSRGGGTELRLERKRRRRERGYRRV